jgi:hypothetical protein
MVMSDAEPKIEEIDVQQFCSAEALNKSGMADGMVAEA